VEDVKKGKVWLQGNGFIITGNNLIQRTTMIRGKNFTEKMQTNLLPSLGGKDVEVLAAAAKWLSYDT